MGIDRGDRFDYLVSMRSPERGLDAWRAAHVPADSPSGRKSISARCGESAPLRPDESNRGSEGDLPRLSAAHLLRHPNAEEYTPIDKFKAEYEHPLWKHEGELARKLGGHGGMDFLMVYRLIECMHKGTAPDLDVYDAEARR